MIMTNIISKIKHNILLTSIISGLSFWVIFSIICFKIDPNDALLGNIVAKFEFVVQITTIIMLVYIYKNTYRTIQGTKQNILILFVTINLWLFIVDILFYIAAYANNSLLQKLPAIYFLLYYAPCIIFAVSTIIFLYKILIKNILFINIFAKKFIWLTILTIIIFMLFLTSMHYAFKVFALNNILQIILLLVEFIAFDISILGLIYARNSSAMLFLIGIITLVTGDFFLTYTYISQTTTLYFLGELLWFLGLIFLLFTTISIKVNKQHIFTEWFRSDNAIKSRLGFGVLITSISSFLITFMFSYFCGLITNQIFVVFPPFIMVYSVVSVTISVFIARTFEEPFKKLERNIDYMLQDIHSTKINHDFEIEEFIFLNQSLLTAFKGKEEKDIIRKEFGDLAAEVSHDIRSPLTVVYAGLKKLEQSGANTKAINDIVQSLQEVSDIADYLLHSYRNMSDEYVKNINIAMPNQKVYVEFDQIVEQIIKNKRIEWQCCANQLQYHFINTAGYTLVYLSPQKIKRIISNILNNAYESMNKTKINITVHLQVSDTHFTLSIQDNGCGIPANKLQDVLTGKSLKHNGNGIGLWSAIKYLQSIKGELSMESKLDVGTIVTISLPIYTNCL